MHNNRFCFKISADAGLAHDGQGNNSPAYMEVKFDTSEPFNSTEREQAHEELVLSVSKQLDIEPSHLLKITEREYDDNH